MEFDKNKVYGLINADKSLIGCRGYFAHSLALLKKRVTEGDNSYISTLTDVLDENESMRYQNESFQLFSLFYLVEKPEKSEKTRKLSVDELEDIAAKFAIKNVCKNCILGCKKVDLLCGCVRYYMEVFKEAFMAGYRGYENKSEEECPDTNTNVDTDIDTDTDIIDGMKPVDIIVGNKIVAKVLVSTDHYGPCAIKWSAMPGLTCEGQYISHDKYAMSTYINGEWQYNKRENWKSPNKDAGGWSLEGSGESGSTLYSFRYSI